MIDHVIKFLLIGESGAGKSSFLKQYMDGTFNSRFTSTVGIDYRQKNIVYSQGERYLRICLQMWDTAGQERYKSITRSFFRDALGFIVLFDLTNEQSFLRAQNWIAEARAQAYCDRPDILLCGNKCDLHGERVISAERGQKLADHHGVRYIETSARTNENVQWSVEFLLDNVAAKIKTNRNNVANFSLKLGPRDQINDERVRKNCLCYVY